MVKKCLNCAKFLTCTDPFKVKVMGHSCSSHKRMTQEHPSNAELIPRGGIDFAESVVAEDKKIKKKKSQIIVDPLEELTEDAEDNFVADAMSRAYDPDTNTIRDLRVDDTSLKIAKNFFDFCFKIIGTGQPPFARQMWMGFVLLAEFCVAKGTLIQTDTGLKPIESLVKPGLGMNSCDFKVVTRDGNNKAEWSGLTARSKSCLTINVSGEIPLKVTPKHKVLVLKNELTLEWIEAVNLKIGDFLVSKLGANLWPTKAAQLNTDWQFETSGSSYEHVPPQAFKPLVTVTPELARLTGYLLTDGSISNNRLSFGNEDKDLLVDYIYCATKVFKLDFHTVASKLKKVFTTSGAMSINLPKWCCSYLASIGLKAGVAYTKDVPEYIMESDQLMVANFMSAVFDSDGWIDQHKDTGRIGLLMHNENIVNKVHLLLKNMGIDGFYKRERAKIQSPLATSHDYENFACSWRASNLQSRKLFADLIGSKHSKKVKVINWIKQLPIDEKLFITNYTGKVASGFVPWDNYPDLQSILSASKGRVSSAGRTTRKEVSGIEGFIKFDKRCFPKIVKLKQFTIQFSKIPRFLSRSPERRLLASRLSELARLGYTFSKVTNIQESGKVDVYDLTVPNTESFQAGGVLVHNCPRCTKPFWYEDILNIPVDMDPWDLRKKVAFLEFGVCPYCEATKHDLIASGELNDKTELIMIAGQRCVTGDAMALTSSGITTFTELAKHHPNTAGFHAYNGPDMVNERGELVTPSHFYVAKSSHITEVKTELGYAIKGTTDHPIWTMTGWKKLPKIKVGEEMPIRVGQNVWGNSTDITLAVTAGLNWFNSQIKTGTYRPLALCEHQEWIGTELTEDLASFLGYWIAEGHTESISHMSVYNLDPAVINLCTKVLDKFSPGLVTAHGRSDENLIKFNSRKISAVFNELLDGQIHSQARSADKFIPNCILRAPKEIVMAFLRALYEGDGGMNGATVQYSSISKKLVTQVQIVLANIGIVSKIRHRMTWATNGTPEQIEKTVYLLDITGSMPRAKFRKLVGFSSKRKIEALDKSIDYAITGKHNSGLTDVFPCAYASRILEAFTSANQELKLCTYYQQEYFYRTAKFSIGMFTPIGVFRRIRNKAKVGDKVSRYLVSVAVSSLQDSKGWALLSDNVKAELSALKKIAEDSTLYWTTACSVRTLKKEKTYDVCIPDGHRFMANGLLNHNSGKSTISVMLIAYITHMLLKSPKLSALYPGIQEFSPLTCTMVATTAHQASKTLWSPFRRLVDSSSWYTELFQILDLCKGATGKELYQFKQVNGLYLRFFHKNLDLYSSGPAKRTLRGDTRFAAVTDELGLFPFNTDMSEEDQGEDDRERANADEVHQSLSNSLTTVQGAIIAARLKGINHLPQGINFNISSPFSWMDKICRLYLENGNNPSACCVKQPTWEITPLFTKDHPVIIAAYRRNAKKAERDYGANPPKIGSDFYQRESVLKCFQIEPWYGVSYEADAVNTIAKAVRKHLCAKHPPAVLALDAGSTDNAFSLALAYRKGGDVIVPVLIEVVPVKGKIIHFPSMYTNIILPICKACNVKVLLSDRWNSLQILQQAKDDVPDLKAQQYSVKMSDFINVVGLVESGCLIFPKLDLDPAKTELVTDYKHVLRDHPADHLYLQCLTVQELGGTVVKGASPAGIRYTDDLHRAMVLAVTGVLNDRVATYLSKFKEIDRGPSAGPGVIVVGRSTFYTAQTSAMGYGRRFC